MGAADEPTLRSSVADFAELTKGRAPELHADEARWLFNACPQSPLLQRRACPPEVPEEPCSMQDEY